MPRKPDYFRRSQFKRYQAQRFHNPFFQRPVKRASWRLRLTIAAFFLLLFGILYLVAFAPFWMIRLIDVQGLQYMSASPIKELALSQLESRRWLIFPQSHPWFFKEEEFKQALQAQYAFETITVYSEDHTLVISVTERVSQVIWFSRDQSFFVDLTGTVIRTLTSEESQDLSVSGPVVEGPFPTQERLRSLPRIVDQNNELLVPGQTVLVDGGVAKVVEINGFLVKHGLAPDHFEAERSGAAWIRVGLREGFDVLFDLTNDTADQVANLLAILGQEVKNRTTLEYIDVRFGNHVYVQGGE